MEPDHTTPSSGRIDLSGLFALSRGNKSLELRYIDAFIDSMQADLDVMKTALNQNNGKLLCDTLHRIRAQLHFYGLHGTFEKAKTAENLLLYNNLITPEVNKMVDFIFKEIIFASEEFVSLKNNYL